jgi:hypothetical protein
MTPQNLIPCKFLLVREPSKRLPEGLSQDEKKEVIDYEKALEQWLEYV